MFQRRVHMRKKDTQMFLEPAHSARQFSFRSTSRSYQISNEHLCERDFVVRIIMTLGRGEVGRWYEGYGHGNK